MHAFIHVNLSTCMTYTDPQDPVFPLDTQHRAADTPKPMPTKILPAPRMPSPLSAPYA